MIGNLNCLTKTYSCLMGKNRILLVLILMALLGSCHINQQPKIKNTSKTVSIQNEYIKFEFALDIGTYEITDFASNEIVVSDAIFKVNDWRSDAQGQERTWEKRTVETEFGTGLALDFAVSGQEQPDLLFTVILYPDQSFMEIAGGINNTTEHSVQLKDLYVLSDAAIYPGQDVSQDFAMIDGFSGGEPLEYGKRLYSPLTRRNALKSRNNILFTFTSNEDRKTLIMGGLTYHDYDKFAWVEQSRRTELQKGQDGENSLISYLNLPLDLLDQQAIGEESLALLSEVSSKKWQYHEFNCSESATTAMAVDSIVISINNLNPDGRYYLGFSWWRSLWHGNRKDHFQSVFVEFEKEGLKERLPLFENQILPLFDGVKKQGIQQVEILLPEPAVSAGQARIIVTHADWEKIPKELMSKDQTDRVDPNVYLSEIWLRDGSKRPLLGPILTDIDNSPRPRYEYTAQLFASDLVGKRVDAGQSYRSEDRFYINTSTADPFEGLENYGMAVKKAQGVQLSMYDFPSVCLWYAENSGYGGGKAENTSLGAVNEMEIIKNTGFLNYSRAAVRLVPDSYMPDNQQGWWDDEHWQREVVKHNGSKNGRYLEPYETSEKWGKAVTDLGGIPLTYFQAGFRSEDYAKAFPEHMLFNKTYAWKGQEYDINSELFTTWNQTWSRNGKVWAYDYTDPGFIEHLKEVYVNMKKGGIKGLMFDYPASGRAKGGGMEDQYSTTAAAYRNIFRLPNEGLGPGAYVHERNMEIGSDVSIGNIASMRTENDTDEMDAATVTRCGLRWYKNRVIYNQDTDSKNIARLQGNQDAVRAVLTMAYVTTGRLLLANSFVQFTDQTYYDITRTFPYHTANQSARPIDAFVSDIPSVYDFEINPQWHQVTFFNPDFNNSKEIKIRISGDPVDGALNLDPDKNYLVYDFWNDTFCGEYTGLSEIRQTLRPGEARMLSVREKLNHPQVLSTNRHIMQGYLDMENVTWNTKKKELSGTSQVIANDPYSFIVCNNGSDLVAVHTNDTEAKIKSENLENSLTRITIELHRNNAVHWVIEFKD